MVRERCSDGYDSSVGLGQLIKECRRRLLNDEAHICDLVATKHLSKDPRKYRQRVSPVIAAEQLAKEGAEVHTGKNIRFLFTSATNKRYERRVRAEELIERDKSIREKYLLLLYSATTNILSPLGYTPRQVYDAVREYSHTELTTF